MKNIENTCECAGPLIYPSLFRSNYLFKYIFMKVYPQTSGIAMIGPSACRCCSNTVSSLIYYISKQLGLFGTGVPHCLWRSLVVNQEHLLRVYTRQQVWLVNCQGGINSCRTQIVSTTNTMFKICV